MLRWRKGITSQTDIFVLILPRKLGQLGDQDKPNGPTVAEDVGLRCLSHCHGKDGSSQPGVYFCGGLNTHVISIAAKLAKLQGNNPIKPREKEG